MTPSFEGIRMFAVSLGVLPLTGKTLTGKIANPWLDSGFRSHSKTAAVTSTERNRFGAIFSAGILANGTSENAGGAPVVDSSHSEVTWWMDSPLPAETA
jgi:hypothetical protein